MSGLSGVLNVPGERVGGCAGVGDPFTVVAAPFPAAMDASASEGGRADVPRPGGTAGTGVRALSVTFAGVVCPVPRCGCFESCTRRFRAFVTDESMVRSRVPLFISAKRRVLASSTSSIPFSIFFLWFTRPSRSEVAFFPNEKSRNELLTTTLTCYLQKKKKTGKRTRSRMKLGKTGICREKQKICVLHNSLCNADKKKKGAAGPHKQETKMYKTAKRAEREEKVCGPLFLPKITAVFFPLLFISPYDKQKGNTKRVGCALPSAV